MGPPIKIKDNHKVTTYIPIHLIIKYYRILLFFLQHTSLSTRYELKCMGITIDRQTKLE